MHPIARFLCTLVALGIVASGCGGSTAAPAAPTSTSASTAAVSVTVTGGAPAIGTTSQLTATAGSSNGSTTNVTAQATWQTASAAIATVTGAGLASGVTAGEVDVRATFQGVTGVLHLTILPATFALSGAVTDAASNAVLSNIAILVTGGANTGKIATTDSAGKYGLTDLTAGTFALSASGTGYQTAAKTVTVPGDARADFVLPRSAPVPAPVQARFAISATATRGWSSITVTVNGKSIGTLRKPVEPGPPTCVAIADTRLLATVTPGTVTYSARSDVGTTWNGSASVAAGGCVEQQLTCTNRDCSAPPPAPVPTPSPQTQQMIVDYMAILHAQSRRSFTANVGALFARLAAAGTLLSGAAVSQSGNLYVASVETFVGASVAFVRLTSQTATIDKRAVGNLFSTYAAQDAGYAGTYLYAGPLRSVVWPAIVVEIQNRTTAAYASAILQLP